MAIPDCRAGATKSSAAVLAKFLHLERVPKDCREWRVNATNANALADTLRRGWDRAVLFRRLATLRTDIAVFNDVEELRWKGPTKHCAIPPAAERIRQGVRICGINAPFPAVLRNAQDEE